MKLLIILTLLVFPGKKVFSYDNDIEEYESGPVEATPTYNEGPDHEEDPYPDEDQEHDRYPESEEDEHHDPEGVY